LRFPLLPATNGKPINEATLQACTKDLVQARAAEPTLKDGAVRGKQANDGMRTPTHARHAASENLTHTKISKLSVHPTLHADRTRTTPDRGSQHACNLFRGSKGRNGQLLTQWINSET